MPKQQSATWDQLAISPDAANALRAICNQAKNISLIGREKTRAKGLVTLFAGPDTNCKMLAAQLIASELGGKLHRIGLSSMVSKQVGETEKQLGKVFDTARGSNAILLFDEGDALFDRRTEVKDSHDRYANIEAGYLLQRAEAHHGLVILIANAKSSIDPAFIRRMNLVVEFPSPDTSCR
jgi:SpoVK/Ycf46/Vps4 family AAA+-type ATPase